MSSFSLGSLLKELREEKNVTVRELAKLINFSYTYISSVENDNKSNPSQKFLESYIYGLAKNSEEIHDMKNKVNNLTNGKYFKEDDSLIDAFLSANAPNVMNIREKNITTEKKFTFPVNDIGFHLNDKYNAKYFRKLKLTDDDREYIYKFINDYFIRKVQLQKREVEHQKEISSIDEKVADKHIEDYNKLIDKLNDSNELKY
ncbi:MAG: helix-turn-helix transcriptional regulator [Staphylococcus simulans]|uniref:helix-turn-helix domain-containing protein n=1 Tax=Staphylococcus TaxID=1279 RepID=UPI0007643522|nr:MULTISPECIES: helix-turn-helix transcriptional regulator [Staphylococcus]HBE8406201.1 helix-turn-helix transcriptional regulator [Staphylococcus aureus]KXA44469.1 DNA-binding helix-turn-helix protein [Staphylococcus simulans]MDK7927398.1 helix-turn-helix transcriptional regulator [Staphylococcus simulans]MDK8316064.1 helix-turn-helix transcriptional regulator [Staphylococcus simulans]MDU7037382.1 helix-turn-helix transcriptional regulator [Staphylococcus simulans]